MKKLFIIISHYNKLAQTIKEYLTKMLPIDENNIKIEALGGINDGQELGTEPLKLLEIIEANNDIKEIVIFSDLGSATLSAKAIISMVSDKQIHVSHGSIVENCFSAYVLANSGADFDSVVSASEEQIVK
ncbi:PTS-dependent dihydroxyacetone kinase phosphotransferase subunit DhaM [Mycoplasma sp. AC157]